MTAWEWIEMFGSILLLDFALSGDNALVLGFAVAHLPRRQRTYALVFGGIGAIVSRIILSSIATIILNIPYIQTAGALILLVIAIRLLAGHNQMRQQAGGERENDESSGIYNLTKKLNLEQESSAALTIVVADVTMSLDNVLAVGAAANGAFLPMALGLLVSIIIILFGSALIAELMGHFTWLLDAAALVLAWTSGTMIRDDLYLVHPFNIHFEALSPHGIPLLLCVCMVFFLIYFRWRDWRHDGARGK